MPPHNMVLCMVGTGMLWVGWYGFNAGSAVGADGIAANAFMTTTLATAVASFTWAMAEYAFRGTPSILGFCSGAVAGLVVITPACGFVTSTGAVIIGIAAGLIPYLACWKLKSAAGYDDAWTPLASMPSAEPSALCSRLLASAAANPNLTSDPAKANGLAKLVTDGGLWVTQLKAIGITSAWLLSERRSSPTLSGQSSVCVSRRSRSLRSGTCRTWRGGLPYRRAIMISLMPCWRAVGDGGRRWCGDQQRNNSRISNT